MLGFRGDTLNPSPALPTENPFRKKAKGKRTKKNFFSQPKTLLVDVGNHVLTSFSLLGVHTCVLVSMNLCAYVWEEQKSGGDIPQVPSCSFYIDSCIVAWNSQIRLG